MLSYLLLAATGIPQLWYALPLAVTISLVYAATRHEEMGPIVQHALRFGLMVVVVMVIVFAVFFAMSWYVSA